MASESNMYVIRDSVAQESGPIFEAKNDGIALRNFRQFLAKLETAADEQHLIHVGMIDHESDVIVAVKPREVPNAVL